jgi:hypothetical protein
MANDDDNDEDRTPTPQTTTAAAAANADANANDDEGYTSAALNARELEWAVNPPELAAEHKKFNGSVVRTRYDVRLHKGRGFVCADRKISLAHLT